MNLDPQYHLPPGRRTAVDALVSERFSRPTWWTPPEFVDTRLSQGKRRRALAEAIEDIKETE